jgi:uncharacterized repeat protein (TIGR04076 family)
MKPLLIKVKEIRGKCENHIVGDCFRVDDGRLSFPGRNKHVCIYALASILPLIPAKQRNIVEERDWLPKTKTIQCPDPDGTVIWEIEELKE